MRSVTELDVAKKPWQVFDEEILPHLNVERLFGDLRTLRREGRFWQASCPIHCDQQGAFSIDPERLEWNCFLGCGGGGPIQYLQKLRRISWMEAASELARLGGVDPSVLEPWRECWTEEDFSLHEKLEARSSLLTILVVYARSIFRSRAGKTLRICLVSRHGFCEEGLDSLELGLYPTPEDVWHYMKKTARNLEEVRGWGLFESRWTGRIVVPWKDLHGRIVNLWGWQISQVPKGKAMFEECLLFEQKRTFDGSSAPFHLDAACRLSKKKLLLLKSPVEVLLLRSWDFADPFPVAAGANLNGPQVESLEECLSADGELTLCWNYDPGRVPAKKKAMPVLERLKKAKFPLYVVDAAALADAQHPERPVTVPDFILQHGGGKPGLRAFTEVLSKREAQILVQAGLSEGGPDGWPGVFEIFRGFSSRGADSWAGESGQKASSFNFQVLEPLFRAAEEIGRRVAAGFLKALPKGLAQGLAEENLALSELASEGYGRPASLPAPDSREFSIQEVEERARSACARKLPCWEPLDRLGVRLSPGDLAIVAGPSSQGKTSFLLSLLLKWLSGREKDSNYLFLFYSLEETEVRIYHRLLSILTALDGGGWTSAQIEEYFAQESQSRFGENGPEAGTLEWARSCLRQWEESIQIACRPGWTVEEVEAHAREVASHRSVGAIFVDSIPAGSRQGTGKSAPARQAVRRLKAVAVDVFCPVVASAAMKTDEGRPALHRVSPAIRLEADVVVGLLKRSSGMLAAGILKNRYGPAGIWQSLVFEERFGLIKV